MTLEASSLTTLKAVIAGTVLLPGDESYEAAATVSTVVGAPAVIVLPATAADVAAAVGFASAEGLVLSVRSGGHSGAGLSTNTGGLVINLTSMNSVEVQGSDRVRIEGGAVWGDIANALTPHNLAISSGDTTSVGVGGLTLGGGIGWMVRKYGLALDSLLSAEVVTAAGEILIASAESNPELFWALRGGGGNFGVVTSFTFQAHPLAGVVGGSISFGMDDLEATLTAWRDVMRAAPEELNSTFVAMPTFGPDMPAGVQLLVCYAGDDETAAMAAIDPLLQIPGVLDQRIAPMAYAETLEEAHPPAGPMLIVDNNGFSADLSDAAIGVLASYFQSLDMSVLMIRSLDGAFNRVASDATAFAHRDAEMLVLSAAFLPGDAPAEAVQAVRDRWNTLSAYLTGTYGNFRVASDEAVVAEMYPPATRKRLAAIKFRYDPGNLFSQNQNILPVAR